MLFLYMLSVALSPRSSFFFFNDTATTEIYTLSLHDALPISDGPRRYTLPAFLCWRPSLFAVARVAAHGTLSGSRSEEHTSELQSPCNLVCRLLLEKKKVNTLLPCQLVYLCSINRGARHCRLT